MANKDYFSLTKEVDIVNPASSVDGRYGPYITMELAMSSLEILGLPGRLFTIQPTIDSEAELYVYQGKGKPPKTTGIKYINDDNSIKIEGPSINTNVADNEQIEIVSNDDTLVFPLKINYEFNYNILKHVFVNGYRLDNNMFDRVEGGIELKDFTSEIVSKPQYKIIIIGNFFIKQ